MKKRIIALGLLWCLSAVMLQAARVDTVLVRSAAMNKDVKVVYVLLIRYRQAGLSGGLSVARLWRQCAELDAAEAGIAADGG